MGKLLGRSIILTILIVSLVIIATHNRLQNISLGIKMIIFIIAGVLLVGITLVVGSKHDKEKAKLSDRSRSRKNKIK